MENSVYIISIIVWSFIWGFATKAVISGKGYDNKEATQWSWYGFFFGIIGFIVACTKPSVNAHTSVSCNSSASNAEELRKYKQLLDEGIITQDEFDSKKKQLLNL